MKNAIIDVMFERCKDCGGYGKDLIHSEHKCLHCIRIENRKRKRPNAFVENQLKDGFEDISPSGDFTILKKVIKNGNLEGSPSIGCPTRIHFISRLYYNGSWSVIVETTRDVIDGVHAGGTDEPFTIRQIGRFRDEELENEVVRERLDPDYISYGRIEIWDDLVLGMNMEEVSQFVCAPSVAYGDEGHPPKVGGNDYVMFEFELLDWDSPLPYMPSRKQMAALAKEQELEDIARAQEHPPVPFQERLELSNKHREQGNEAFKKCNYEAAKASYDAAFVAIYVSDEEHAGLLDDVERQVLRDVKLTLHLNRAQAKLKLQCSKEALWDCDRALELDPCNAKGLYRRVQARVQMVESEIEKDRKKEFWVIEKSIDVVKEARVDYLRLIEISAEQTGLAGVKSLGQSLVRVEHELQEIAKKYRKQEVSLFRDKIWKGLEEENNAVLEQQNKEDVVVCHDDLSDLPELE